MTGRRAAARFHRSDPMPDIRTSALLRGARR